MTSTDFLDTIDSQLDWQRGLYTDFHRQPELGLEEHNTSERIESELKDMGLAAKRISKTGFAAVIENGDGPTVLARADIDALPVSEDTGVDYSSTIDGVMHACGHDMHITALLGAVRLLNENFDDGLTSKIPKPDIAYAQHVMPMPTGTVNTKAGPSALGRRFREDHRARSWRSRIHAAPVRGPRGPRCHDRSAPADHRLPRGRTR